MLVPSDYDLKAGRATEKPLAMKWPSSTLQTYQFSFSAHLFGDSNSLHSSETYSGINNYFRRTFDGDLAGTYGLRNI